MIFCRVNDIIIRINGKPTYNMGQGQAVRELKSCGNRVELVRDNARAFQPHFTFCHRPSNERCLFASNAILHLLGLYGVLRVAISTRCHVRIVTDREVAVEITLLLREVVDTAPEVAIWIIHLEEDREVAI